MPFQCAYRLVVPTFPVPQNLIGNMDASPLARLPLELRESIYTYALVSDDEREITADVGQKSDGMLYDELAWGQRPWRRENGKYALVLAGKGVRYHTASFATGSGKLQRINVAHGNHILGLSQTCRQIHEESTPLFYKLNRFIIYDRNYAVKASSSYIKRFIKQIGPRNAASLRNVTVMVRDIEFRFARGVHDAKSQLAALSQVAKVNPGCDYRLQAAMYYDMAWCGIYRPAPTNFLLRLQDLAGSSQAMLAEVEGKVSTNWRGELSGEYVQLKQLLGEMFEGLVV
jgi:hypothetical protein